MNTFSWEIMEQAYYTITLTVVTALTQQSHDFAVLMLLYCKLLHLPIKGEL